jgi:type I restriction enzyme S subunit
MGELFAHPRLHDVEMKRLEVTEGELSRFALRAGDLLFARRSLIAEGAGAVCLVVEAGEATVFESSLIKARVDPQRADIHFLYYWFRSPIGRAALATILRQTAVSGITGSDLSNLELPLPPHGHQTAAANMLRLFDEKIELNRRMVRTLEEMARALFRSWFVDFEPVLAKMEGRDLALPADAADLFPDRFGDDALPNGWELKRLDSLAQQHREMLSPGNFPDEMFAHFSIPAFDVGQVPAPDFGASIKSQKLLVTPGLLLVSKLNPETPRIWLVPATDDRAVASTEFVGFRPNEEVSTVAWLWGLATSQAFRDTMAGMVTGTSKSHQRVQPPAMLASQWPFPGWPLVEAFDRIAAPMLARAQVCRDESRTLAALRDTLLPKLISGELRISDAETLVNEAA